MNVSFGQRIPTAICNVLDTKENKYYITNLGKCTQVDARPLPDSVLKQYLNIFIDMIDVQIKVKNPPVTRKENNNNENRCMY